MGALSVEASADGSSWKSVWTKSGPQQATSTAAWLLSGRVGLPYGKTRVRFKGVKGSSYTGDMSVDNVTLTVPSKCAANSYGAPGSSACTQCPTSSTSAAGSTALANCACTTKYLVITSGKCSNPNGKCAFESGACGWTESGKPRRERCPATPSLSTGAAKAQGCSHFMYLETTSGTTSDTVREGQQLHRRHVGRHRDLQRGRQGRRRLPRRKVRHQRQLRRRARRSSSTAVKGFRCTAAGEQPRQRARPRAVERARECSGGKRARRCASATNVPTRPQARPRIPTPCTGGS